MFDFVEVKMVEVEILLIFSRQEADEYFTSNVVCSGYERERDVI